MTVDQSIAVGAYPLTLTLSYLRVGRGIVTVTVPLTIVVNKPSLPALKITTSASKITPGQENTITLTVENMGNTSVNDIDITDRSLLTDCTGLVHERLRRRIKADTKRAA